MENNNLRRLSFVLNHNNQKQKDEISQLSSINQSINGKLIKKASLSVGAPFEEEIQQMGFEDDLEMIKILEAAVLHPRLEILQLVQCMRDYYQAYQYILYLNSVASVPPISEREQNDNILFMESERQEA